MPEPIEDQIRALTLERSADENARAAELLLQFPMPSDRADDVLNRTELSKAFTTSEPTVDRWIADGVPLLQSGSNGKAYRFRLAEVRAWLKWKDAEEKAEEARKAEAIRQMQMELLGGDHNASGETALTPKQKRELYETEAAYNKLAATRGELVQRGDVIALLDRVFSIVRNSVNSMPDRLARDGGLSGHQIEQAVAISDDMLSDMHQELEAFSAELDGGVHLEAAE